jgi:opacity protein-like surface antigen
MRRARQIELLGDYMGRFPHPFLVVSLVISMGDMTAVAGGFYLGLNAGASSVSGQAETTSTAPSMGLPTSLSLNGVPFDDSDMAWGALVGYQFPKYVAIEGGYTNLGTFRSEQLFNFFLGAPGSTPSLESKEFSVRSRVRFPLTEKWSATWHLGLSVSSFEAGGSLPLTTVPFPPLGSPTQIPFSDPKNEIGYLWGFGVNWGFSKRVSLDLNYSRHDVQVLDVDTFNLGFIFSL